MSILLDVNVLPRGNRSRTRKLRDAFVGSFMKEHAGWQRVEIDLARRYEELPAFDEWDIQAKFEMMYGAGKLDPESARRWNALAMWTDQLHLANAVVLSTPMWNFSIPWHLKRWIDTVVQGRLTFEYVGGEFRGLLAKRPAVIITSRDGAYGPESPYRDFDFQLPYLRHILSFMGLGPIHEVVAEPMVLHGPDVAEAALSAAVDRALDLGQSL